MTEGKKTFNIFKVINSIKLQVLGKVVMVAGISASLFTLGSCDKDASDEIIERFKQAGFLPLDVKKKKYGQLVIMQKA